MFKAGRQPKPKLAPVIDIGGVREYSSIIIKSDCDLEVGETCVDTIYLEWDNSHSVFKMMGYESNGYYEEGGRSVVNEDSTVSITNFTGYEGGNSSRAEGLVIDTTKMEGWWKTHYYENGTDLYVDSASLVADTIR